jgi:hypothetical protein
MRQRLDAAIRLDPAPVVEGLLAAFEQLTSSRGNAFVLVGAGQLGHRTLAGLRKKGIEPLAFADNNSSLWGGQVDGLEVLPPDGAVRRYGQSAVFAVTVFNPRRLTEQFRELGASSVVSYAPLHWAFADSLLPFCDLELPRSLADHAAAIAGVDLLADEAGDLVAIEAGAASGWGATAAAHGADIVPR